MKRNQTNDAYLENGLELQDAEIMELENDEDKWWAHEEALLRQTEEKMGEVI